MSQRNVRIGVIGLGAIGPSHAYSVQRATNCTLSAICDVRRDAAEKAGAEYGVPFFDDVRKMCESGTVDAVTIATPSGFHLEPAIAAIESGKHVLSEKPMEITVERIDRIGRIGEGSRTFEREPGLPEEEA